MEKQGNGSKDFPIIPFLLGKRRNMCLFIDGEKKETMDIH